MLTTVPCLRSVNSRSAMVSHSRRLRFLGNGGGGGKCLQHAHVRKMCFLARKRILAAVVRGIMNQTESIYQNQWRSYTRWLGWRIFWPRNDLAPLLRWRRHRPECAISIQKWIISGEEVCRNKIASWNFKPQSDTQTTLSAVILSYCVTQFLVTC